MDDRVQLLGRTDTQDVSDTLPDVALETKGVTLVVVFLVCVNWKDDRLADLGNVLLSEPPKLLRRLILLTSLFDN